MEYENLYAESATRSSSLGIEMNRKVKRIGCSAIKDILEEKKLAIHDEQTILEASTFIASGVSFEASDGNHDDLMMNLVLFAYFSVSNFFSDMTNINVKEMLFKQKMEEIEADVVPFGVINTHEDNGPSEEDLELYRERERWQIWNPDEDDKPINF
jgi:hypothetical protein